MNINFGNDLNMCLKFIHKVQSSDQKSLDSGFSKNQDLDPDLDFLVWIGLHNPDKKIQENPEKSRLDPAADHQIKARGSAPCDNNLTNLELATCHLSRNEPKECKFEFSM